MRLCRHRRPRGLLREPRESTRGQPLLGTPAFALSHEGCPAVAAKRRRRDTIITTSFGWASQPTAALPAAIIIARFAMPDSTRARSQYKLASIY
jgi:hypothetical protein